MRMRGEKIENVREIDESKGEGRGRIDRRTGREREKRKVQKRLCSYRTLFRRGEWLLLCSW